ncbi:MAG TPA: hypothetical protein H9976_06640 [Candidatus Akkermansia intestinavium]|nr:hypothetical protein [Candidatus Akkermansia intestinavium]
MTVRLSICAALLSLAALHGSAQGADDTIIETPTGKDPADLFDDSQLDDSGRPQGASADASAAGAEGSANAAGSGAPSAGADAGSASGASDAGAEANHGAAGGASAGPRAAGSGDGSTVPDDSVPGADAGAVSPSDAPSVPPAVDPADAAAGEAFPEPSPTEATGHGPAAHGGEAAPSGHAADVFPGVEVNPEGEDQHVVSQSRMFSVSGGEALRMGAIASRADALRAQLVSLLNCGNRWRYAISIRLLGRYEDPPSRTPVRVRVRVIDKEPNFQIRIFCGGGIKLERLDRALIATMLYEFALRDLSGDELPDQVNMPDWLVTGLYQAILCRQGKADRRAYQSLANRAEMPDPEKIVNVKTPWKLDAASRQVYDVSCGVLIMCLLHRPGGDGSLRELIKAAALSDEEPQRIIARFFLELSDHEERLSQWWALELAAYAAPLADEMLTPPESDKALSEALTLRYFDPYTALVRPISLDDAYTVTGLEDWQSQVQTNIDQLLRLSHRCFPGYRVIINEYLRAINEMVQGASADEVQAILGPVRELRKAYMVTGIRGRDYLDWYEISTRGGDHPVDLEGYMEAMRLLRQEEPGPTTAISRYLDDIEALHTLPEGEGLPPRLRELMKKLHPRPAKP